MKRAIVALALLLASAGLARRAGPRRRRRSGGYGAPAGARRRDPLRPQRHPSVARPAPARALRRPPGGCRRTLRAPCSRADSSPTIRRTARSFVTRIKHYYSPAGFSSWSAGENLLYNTARDRRRDGDPGLARLARPPGEHARPRVARGRDRLDARGLRRRHVRRRRDVGRDDGLRLPQRQEHGHDGPDEATRRAVGQENREAGHCHEALEGLEAHRPQAAAEGQAGQGQEARKARRNRAKSGSKQGQTDAKKPTKKAGSKPVEREIDRVLPSAGFGHATDDPTA